MSTGSVRGVGQVASEWMNIKNKTTLPRMKDHKDPSFGAMRLNTVTIWATDRQADHPRSRRGGRQVAEGALCRGN